MARGPVVQQGGELLATVAKQRPLEAEEVLMLAVLEQAVADLGDSSPEVRADADAYIFASRDDGTFSFGNVCAYFKLSPTAVREALRARRQTRVKDSLLSRAA
ncbi:MAG TPA: hypothetical protein VEB21_07385 [Terriglobales bacterium]|nr:hypothetical protein [Terriglobales bacterium]